MLSTLGRWNPRPDVLDHMKRKQCIPETKVARSKLRITAQSAFELKLHDFLLVLLRQRLAVSLPHFFPRCAVLVTVSEMVTLHLQAITEEMGINIRFRTHSMCATDRADSPSLPRFDRFSVRQTSFPRQGSAAL